MNQQLNLKFPLLLRIGISAVCSVFVFSGVVAAHRSVTSLIAMSLMTVLAIHIVSYRVEVTKSEVRLRFWPFLHRSILVEDVQHLAEGRTIILVTPTSKIPLWGLSMERRSELFHILLHRLQVKEPAKSNLEKTPLQWMKWHLRIAKIVGVAFLTTSVALVPIMKGYPWHKYWEPWGKCLLIIDMALFILLVFESGMSFIYWQYLH